MTEFSWPVRVYYEDTDAGGVVYYANYLRYLERARTEMLRASGFEQDDLAHDHDILFIVRKVTIDYLKPAFFNDALRVNAKITERRKASLLFEQAIFNEQQERICQAEVLIACISKTTMKPVSIPDFILPELAHVD